MGGNGSKIDISDGVLTINGDARQQVYDDTELGKLVAYGGSGVLLFDYDITNAGKTTVLAGASTDHNWNTGGAGSWNSPGNWVEASVPTRRDKVTIDVAGSQGQITSGVDAVCLGLTVGNTAGTCSLDMTGGTLQVGQYAVPRDTAIGGQVDGIGIVNISAGTVDIAGNLVVGNHGTGTLNVSGGTVNVNKTLTVAAGTGSGTVNLSGGTINIGADIINAGLDIKDIGSGLLDIKGGTLIINGDATARVKDYAASGKIVAYGGRGTLNINYNTINAGKTTVTATSSSAVAYNPSPAAGATFVSTNPTLTWTAGTGATSHAVYFGTDYNSVNTATTSTSGIYKGSQSTASYLPAVLDEGVAYFWRIDEVSGSTAKGNVWSFTAECPDDLRTTINFNSDWRYHRGTISGDAASASSYNDTGWQSIHVPQNFKTVPLDVAPWVLDKSDINWYRKYFTIPAEYSGKKIFIEFEGVDNKAWVWINGTAVSSHQGAFHSGAFLPFTVDITDYVNFGSAVNVLVVKADNYLDADIPEFDRDSYGGLWRNVKMHITNKLHITDAVDANVVAGGGIFVSYSNVSSTSATVNVKTHVQNDNASSANCIVKTFIVDADDNVIANNTADAQSIGASGTQTFTQSLTVTNPALWSPSTPYLYTVVTEVYDGNTYADGYNTPIGIKTVAFSHDNGFSINGEHLIWVGVNRVQTYPWTATAMSDFQQKLDARRMRDAGWNLVRTAHSPASNSFMEACDELGMMVEDSIPGFHDYRVGAYEQNSYLNMRDMIRRDRNHASPVTWELQINEGTYTVAYSQNAVAIGHEEIPQAPNYVCGWLWDANDVFDIFLCAAQHGGRGYPARGPSPLIISEHGHWDYGGNNSTSDASRANGEAMMLQQAWNHQESHHLNRAVPGVCGDNVWVYSDRGLPSGVTDPFRLPKFSFYFWQSQRDPSLVSADFDSGPMVHIANYWKSNSPADVKVFSNCQQVKLYVNGQLKATQSPDSVYPTASLQHPPFTFTGITWESGELKAEGLIGGQVVATHIVNTPGSAGGLSVNIDTLDYDVTANGEDMVFVYVTVVDSSGNIVPDATNAVTLTVVGPATLVSQAVANAEAGIASFMIRTMPEAGKITVSAAGSGLTGGSDSITTVAQTDKAVWVSQLTPSVITSTPVTTATAGKLYTYDVDATGIPASTYSLTTSPSGMTINSTTGVISWIPDANTQLGSNSVTVQATNGIGTDTQSFSINTLAERWWSSNGANDKWSTPQNWWGNVVPTNNNIAFLDVNDNTTIIDSSVTAVCDGLRVGEWHWNCRLSITGGSLTVDNDMYIAKLQHQWGYSQAMVYMSGGTVNIGGNLYVCNDGWWGLFSMTGGTVNVAGTVWVPSAVDIAYGNSGWGEVQLAGGTLTANDLDRTTLCRGSLFNITNGTLILNGNKVSKLQGYVTQGWLKAYNGNSILAISYNSTTDKTQVTAIAPVAPVIISTPVTTATVGKLYRYDVNSTGLPAPTYMLVTAPAGMTINSTTGLISWSPGVNQLGSNAVSVRVYNSVGVNTQSFSINTVAEKWWSGSGANTKWSTPANWWGSVVPNNNNVAFIDTEGKISLIDSSVTAVCDGLHVGEWEWNCRMNITGGSLTVDNDMYIATMKHQYGYAQGMVYMSGGTVNIGGNLYVCNNGWWGLFEITGGTVNVAGTVWVPSGVDANDEGAAWGEVRLYGGTLTANDLERNELCGGSIFDITTGTLILNGNKVSKLQGYVTAGWLKAYNGNGMVVIGYNSTTNKTQVTALAPAVPVIISTPVTTATVGKSYTYDVNATGIRIPTYSLITSPAGMTINSTTGVISWAPNANQLGSNSVSVRATNNMGSNTQSFSINTVAEKWWSGNGADTKWSTLANWWGSVVPNNNNVAFIDVEGKISLIDSSVTAVCDGLHVGEWEWNCRMNITGGSLTIDNDMYIANMKHQYGYAQGMVYMSGGTVNIGGNLYVCNNGWWGLLSITGGTVNVAGTVWVPSGVDVNDAGAAWGEVQLTGGTLTANDLERNALCGGSIFNITTGTLILNGNKVSKLEGYVTEGWLKAYNGNGTVVIDYNSVTNKTQVTAVNP